MVTEKKCRPSDHTHQQKQIKEVEGNICLVCWDVNGKRARGHHLIPYSEDGSSHIKNFVTLCDSCHSLYHARKLNISIYRF
jgi:5-methylcytosine-specific restriction endonuclease McrA